ncbi:methyltransferase family protein [Aquidulcibacter sp.]|uniref:methyltransferase family protein n=1 Tax=Aquidulcibacter sp. TaxID=2052990 RepID=UPI003BA7E67D
MAGSWRIGAVEGTLGTLVTRGFFAFSRNPVFVGQLALFAGLALVKPDIVQVILSACVWIAAVWQVRIEEPILAKSLGQGYRDYAARTPRWLGLSKE